jgi:hypothetical protein
MERAAKRIEWLERHAETMENFALEASERG